MKCSHTHSDIAEYTARQLNAFFPDGQTVQALELAKSVGPALERVEHCFRHIMVPSYSEENGEAKFTVLHSDQYCAYLYLLSNTVYRSEGDLNVASKLFYLNKALHAFNCMYDTQLPEVFWLAHCIGAVLGKAQYGNYFAALQNCTIGAIRGEYPVLGERVIMSAGSSIIGKCRIGNNVLLAPGCQILKQDIPDDTRVSSAAETRLSPNTDRPARAFFRL